MKELGFKKQKMKKPLLDNKLFRAGLSASLCFSSTQHHDSAHPARSQNFPVDDYVKK